MVTQFRLDKTIGDLGAVGSDCFSIDNPQESELSRQRVHDHGQVPLSNLQTDPTHTFTQQQYNQLGVLEEGIQTISFIR